MIEFFLTFGLLFIVIVSGSLANTIKKEIGKTQHNMPRLPDGSSINNDFVFTLSYITIIVIWSIMLIQIIK
jgi:hypothetical protein